MKSRILLVEPAYKTKYPPLGLMKIATYHKMKGDDVRFVKGSNNDVQYQFWDRVYISTLFTWTWEETVKTINFYRTTLFNFAGKCFVGGILATLMPDDLFNATGIQPVEGLLDDPRKIEQDDDIMIDRLPPDYEILGQVESSDFSYSNKDAYLGYTTRGCVRHCGFCAVRRLEPRYVPYIDISDTVRQITEKSGEKQNLVLMDNNVLASPEFDRIIDTILSLGFTKGAVFGRTRRRRTVDFNQGLDARLLTEEKMRRLSEIPLEPIRLAFDSIKEKDIYVRAVELAHKYGQKDMSNYILYNFHDTPRDFYERMRINIDLNGQFSRGGRGSAAIYSFPMRFIPLNAKSRDADTGNHSWNQRSLRAVHVILGVMRGPVMPGKQFFLQAFGRDAEEFSTICLMPEEFIRNRLVHDWKEKASWEDRLAPYVKDWMRIYGGLPSREKSKLVKILAPNDLTVVREAFDEGAGTRGLKCLLGFHLREKEIVAEYKARC